MTSALRHPPVLPAQAGVAGDLALTPMLFGSVVARTDALASLGYAAVALALAIALAAATRTTGRGAHRLVDLGALGSVTALAAPSPVDAVPPGLDVHGHGPAAELVVVAVSAGWLLARLGLLRRTGAARSGPVLTLAVSGMCLAVTVFGSR